MFRFTYKVVNDANDALNVFVEMVSIKLALQSLKESRKKIVYMILMTKIIIVIITVIKIIIITIVIITIVIIIIIIIIITVSARNVSLYTFIVFLCSPRF